MKNVYPRLVVSSKIRRKIVEVAREFRKEPTEGEMILWNALRGKKLDGIKFRRRQPIGYFVADFYSFIYRFVVEQIGQSISLKRKQMLQERKFSEAWD